MTLDEARRAFAEELRAVAHVTDQRVVDAFAAVPRERFVGPGPWRALCLYEQGYWTTDNDPRALYHNILIALDESRGLNTGEPSLWAYHFDRVGIRAGERVLQIGTGSGYFTAILAELVGDTGSVLGLEVDDALGEAASRNLEPWPQASVHKVNGAHEIEGQWDVIIAFAGASAPPIAWIDALTPGGRALIPLTTDARWGFLLRIDKTGDRLAARSAGNIGIFPCHGLRDAAEAAALGQSLGDPVGRAALKSLRRDDHEKDDTCWLHGAGWCLSKHELS
ncbi:protein-L-isoaspartate(D-aspartate) O-methyltransferase [Enhydrobacter aerosaccus]|uniref:Protein-L-isoaspartate O-methyltransferase n=1 Tax=Enhydrobacter aerosaccus TaxID=225324 RepID=A0A1T4LSP8_9HYPH|nr:protein-L-isoaspartate(D-aspartate) O-methyltransferase [Enhydrobacter aerosaccus]SJZ57646.1 protein-L-isoaspartate(D-aspartate) O-methyltransferase [Enhydrobacter aerosaccus]